MTPTIKPVYVVLCGLPCTGKTTLRDTLYDRWKNPKPIILSTDDYIDLVAQVTNSTYSEKFQSSIEGAQHYVNTLRQGALSSQVDIIHDQTNLTGKSRRKRLAGIPKGAYHTVCIVVTCGEIDRQKRLEARPGKSIPKDVDADMCKNWSYPEWDEGFDIVANDWEVDNVLYQYLILSHTDRKVA